MESTLVVSVPIDRLLESPLNPRKHYDQAALKELAANIKEVGVLSPLLVRPAKDQEGKYEIGAGHRRKRAGIIAKLTELPCLIREMSDTTFIELLTIENLQREDIHPLEEAEGYKTLMEKAGYDVNVVAAKVGKSVSYVYQRMKLAELIPSAQKSFLKNELTAAHAVLIARLTPESQEKAMKYIGGERRYYNATPSLRDLKDWIEREVHLDLSEAPWKKDDGGLLPSAGACTVCPKRTGFSPMLFPDVKKNDTCTDPVCFHLKTATFLEKKLAEAKKSGEDITEVSTNYYHDKGGRGILKDHYKEVKPKSCKFVKPAIVVEGDQVGRSLFVCAAEKQCKTHYQNYERSNANYETRRKSEQKAAAKKTKFLQLSRRRIITEIRLKLSEQKQVDPSNIRLIAAGYVREMRYDTQKAIAEFLGYQPVKHSYSSEYEPVLISKSAAMKDNEIYSFLLTLCMASAIESYPHSESVKVLNSLAKKYKVNVAAIERQAKAEVYKKPKAAKRSPSKPGKAVAKKPNKKTAAKKKR